MSAEVNKAIDVIIAHHADCLACQLHIDHNGSVVGMERLSHVVRERLWIEWRTGYETGRRSAISDPPGAES